MFVVVVCADIDLHIHFVSRNCSCFRDIRCSQIDNIGRCVGRSSNVSHSLGIVHEPVAKYKRLEHFHTYPHTLQLYQSCFDCQHIHHMQIHRKHHFDCCKSICAEWLGMDQFLNSTNSALVWMVPIRCLRVMVVVVVAVVFVFVVHIGLDKRLHWQSYYHFLHIHRNRIVYIFLLWYRSTNEPHSFGNFRFQQLCDTYLWLIWFTRNLQKLFHLIRSNPLWILSRATDNILLCATYLYYVDIVPHTLLMLHNYSYFHHNQCNRMASICYRFGRSANVLV